MLSFRHVKFFLFFVNRVDFSRKEDRWHLSPMPNSSCHQSSNNESGMPFFHMMQPIQPDSSKHDFLAAVFETKPA